MDSNKLKSIYRDISGLTGREKKILLTKLVSEISIEERTSPVSFYEIRGVGKDIWKDIDVQEYIDNERYSWE